MKIALFCCLVLAAVFVAEAGEFCSMDAEKLATTIACMSEKIPAELKEKMAALNTEGLPLPEAIKKHCESGGDHGEALKKALSEEEQASLKAAYGQCVSA